MTEKWCFDVNGRQQQDCSFSMIQQAVASKELADGDLLSCWQGACERHPHHWMSHDCAFGSGM